MKLARLFFVCVLLGGLGGAAGSIVGNAYGKTGLFVGGVAGGLIGAVMGARIAGWRGWIPAKTWQGAGVGAAIGFLAAAYIATKTLSSPVGPVLSTMLIGIGAIVGARVSQKS